MTLLKDDPLIADEIQVAISTTILSLQSIADPNTNFSLCHGHLGNVDFLLTAREMNIESPAGFTCINDVMDFAIAQSANDLPWKCGTQDGRSTPGLMLGLAGIGSMFLRYIDSRYKAPLLLTPKLISIC